MFRTLTKRLDIFPLDLVNAQNKEGIDASMSFFKQQTSTPRSLFGGTVVLHVYEGFAEELRVEST